MWGECVTCNTEQVFGCLPVLCTHTCVGHTGCSSPVLAASWGFVGANATQVGRVLLIILTSRGGWCVVVDGDAMLVDGWWLWLMGVVVVWVSWVRRVLLLLFHCSGAAESSRACTIDPFALYICSVQLRKLGCCS